MRYKAGGMLLLLIAWLCLATDARACGCVYTFGQYQPCGAYWRADVVFTGVVAEVGPMTPVAGSGGQSFTMEGRVTRFTIDEAFRGIAGSIVETFEMGTSCDYHFKPGERYFVYGSRNMKDGKTYVGSCSATKTFDHAEADLLYARGVNRGEPTPGIIGIVSRETRASAREYRQRLPLAGIKVVAEGAGQSYEAATDEKGMFRFFNLPASGYSVRAKTAPDLRQLYGEKVVAVQVADGRCSGAEFVVTSLSTVSGKVVDAEGAAAKSKVNLVAIGEDGAEIPAAESSVETYTNAEGRYKFDWVAPGRYLIAVNARSQPGRSDPPFPRAYLPGVRDSAEATVITIKDGDQYEAEPFRLPPPLKPRAIEGVAVWPDGSPAAHAIITLEFTERDWIETERADEQGRFSLKAYEGYKYLVAAEVRKEVQGVWRGTHSPSVEVVNSDAVPAPLRLVISQPGFYRPRFAQRTRLK